jgi:hypothetical protein
MGMFNDEYIAVMMIAADDYNESDMIRIPVGK